MHTAQDGISHYLWRQLCVRANANATSREEIRHIFQLCDRQAWPFTTTRRSRRRLGILIIISLYTRHYIIFIFLLAVLALTIFLNEFGVALRSVLR